MRGLILTREIVIIVVATKGECGPGTQVILLLPPQWCEYPK
jgi:hypothetical protein